MLKKEDFVVNTLLTPDQLRYHPDAEGKSFFIDPEVMLQAAIKATEDFAMQIAQFKSWSRQGVAVLWDNIMDKNRGGTVAECLGVAYCNLIKNRAVKNPHESGSPDFLPLINETKSFIENPTDVSYEEGGFDAKSSKITNWGFMEAEASSHHRNTTTVLVVGWNYIDDVPNIMCAFFTNLLDKDDWVKSSMKNEESKTTSNARLLASGKHKIRKGWLFLHKSIRPPKDKAAIAEYSLESLLDLKRKQD